MAERRFPLPWSVECCGDSFNTYVARDIEDKTGYVAAQAWLSLGTGRVEPPTGVLVFYIGEANAFIKSPNQVRTGKGVNTWSRTAAARVTAT
jgi:hypothetical protein